MRAGVNWLNPIWVCHFSWLVQNWNCTQERLYQQYWIRFHFVCISVVWTILQKMANESNKISNLFASNLLHSAWPSQMSDQSWWANSPCFPWVYPRVSTVCSSVLAFETIDRLEKACMTLSLSVRDIFKILTSHKQSGWNPRLWCVGELHKDQCDIYCCSPKLTRIIESLALHLSGNWWWLTTSLLINQWDDVGVPTTESCLLQNCIKQAAKSYECTA